MGQEPSRSFTSYFCNVFNRPQFYHDLRVFGPYWPTCLEKWPAMHQGSENGGLNRLARVLPVNGNFIFIFGASRKGVWLFVDLEIYVGRIDQVAAKVLSRTWGSLCYPSSCYVDRLPILVGRYLVDTLAFSWN